MRSNLFPLEQIASETLKGREFLRNDGCFRRSSLSALSAGRQASGRLAMTGEDFLALTGKPQPQSQPYLGFNFLIKLYNSIIVLIDVKVSVTYGIFIWKILLPRGSTITTSLGKR